MAFLLERNDHEFYHGAKSPAQGARKRSRKIIRVELSALKIILKTGGVTKA